MHRAVDMRLMIRCYLVSSILFFSTYSNSYGQSHTGTLFIVDEDSIKSEEFIYVYQKNNSYNNSAFTITDIDNYLELFVNFKLKVTEARTLGLDTTSAYKSELGTYRKQLTQSYLNEQEVTYGLLEEAYARMKYELNVSHILIKVDPAAPPEDTIKARNRALEIKLLSENGQDFNELALLYSDEPMAARTKGHLGYFTALQMVYPFENGAYSTQIGEISDPVRTKFGYHIIKVHDKRPSQGKVTISHIMVRNKPGMSAQDSIAKKNKIFEIHELVTSGYDWKEACLEYSDDLNSRERGGTLSPFGVGEMIPDLAEVAFALQEAGDISDPLQTPYGWHILKLEERIHLKNFDELKPSLSRRVARDARSNKSHEVLIKRLSAENGFVENQSLVHGLFEQIDSTGFDSDWPFKPIALLDTLFFQTDSIYTVSKFRNFIIKKLDQHTVDPSVKIEGLYKGYVDREVVDYEEAHLEEKYEDFRFIMNEYREGILLFEIMDQKVWTPSSIDSVGLKKYYTDNFENYRSKESATLAIFAVSIKDHESKLVNVLTIMSKDTSLAMNDILKRVESGFPEVTIVNSGEFEYGDGKMDDYVREKGIYQLEDNDKGHILYVKENKPSRIKRLDSIRGEVISDYQSYLEEEWISSLKDKYPVRLIKKEVKNVYRILEK